MGDRFPPHRLTEFAPFSEAELQRLNAIAHAPAEHAARDLIRRQGEPPNHIYLLIEGWVASSIELDNGERQITKVHLPGDLMGVTSLGMSAAVDTLMALTPAKVAAVPVAAFGNLMAHWPRLAAVLFLCAQRERVALMDRLTSLGRTSAVESLSGMLLDLYWRLMALGEADDGAFEIRVTQEQMADYLGISAVHVNRALRQLETTGLIARRGRRIEITDMAQLERLSHRVHRSDSAAGRAWVASAEARPAGRAG